ncbi:MAG: PP2C family protein-serine/threonine phosphatase [candidate division KSB1 bacterium]|nr:PP2C family protein-serine/threonine phosphatase [candidate division KSB1 bacterium]MDZ7275184.1 PP2C family protein-serine/threonine phosphatase [candidate division KSB1 bacterium]MDZ7287353.1 PP2C family protein-serine/threonine phosphatase [candidate division KSB1 bacterium]MDZ7299467.1 PP2C family protein-serine/threonine phosphatase [candidate division KSB1 bacterium]MDZ7305487.1 PP2C family protein-serine/threonine phosphatase [candidate division KSB1 bacterium]
MSPIRLARPSLNNAFSQRPWRERRRFATAVFFLFCGVGALSVLVNHAAVPMPVYFVLAMMLASGLFAGSFVLFFGRLLPMILCLAVFLTAMILLTKWGSHLQQRELPHTHELTAGAAGHQTQPAATVWQTSLRRALVRDTLLTLLMIVLSYVTFIDAFNKEWEKRATVESELRVARRIQQNLLPPPEKILPGWRLHGVLQPAATVAGDYFDYLEFAGGANAALVADASGHGVAAGLLMTMLKGQLFTLITEPYEAAALFNRLNDSVRRLAPRNMFVTAVMVVLTQDHSGGIEVVTAGHPPLLYLDAARGRVTELGTPAAALGLHARLSPAPQRFTLNHNDLVLLYTDGVVEQMNAAGTQWGIERLKTELQQHHHLPLAELCQCLLQAGAAFRGRVAPHDDMTLLAIRREPRLSGKS